jgi:hypothetical protein
MVDFRFYLIAQYVDGDFVPFLADSVYSMAASIKLFYRILVISLTANATVVISSSSMNISSLALRIFAQMKIESVGLLSSPTSTNAYSNRLPRYYYENMPP